MNQHQHWLVTVDGRRANLFTCSKTDGGKLHIGHVRSLENGHEREHERHRPSMLGGAEQRGGNRSGANAAPHSASPGHGAEEELLRFIREVNDWLRHASVELGMSAGRVSVFAPPRCLGLLRNQMGDLDSKNMDLLEGELTRLSPQELSEHQAVKDAML